MKLLRALSLSLGVVNAVYYSRSFQTSSWGGNNQPSHHSRSQVNNCGGNCCRGWASGRSGGCTMKLMPTHTGSSFSSPSMRFSYSGSPNTAVSWSSSSRGGSSNTAPNQATFQAYASVSSNPARNQAPSRPSRPSYPSRPSTNVGKAWGSDCTHCNQRPPSNSPQQERRAKCPQRYTQVGNSCRILRGPSSSSSSSSSSPKPSTSDCYRVGGQIVCPGAGGGVVGDQRYDENSPSYVADAVRPDLTYDFGEEDDQYSTFVDVIVLGSPTHESVSFYLNNPIYYDNNLYGASDYGSSDSNRNQRNQQYQKLNPSMEYLRPGQQKTAEPDEAPFYGERSWTNWESWGSSGSTYSENRRPGSSYRSRERVGSNNYRPAFQPAPLVRRNPQGSTQDFYNQVYNTGKNLLNNANAWLGQATHRNSGGCRSGCG
ncbi:Oidioi.mRNA.OKI2018_I69.chr2.g5855.t2.cds [Oikopleura dioica]|uniref:Oidioi.mRNA.OKI2018_I69.chr2.g5855.t2.cds n=1 Tax=Oikopleura dioica TaxID=34765 RepID=A0ABN7T870_OIKDI|nr:Oidioi.mRNA.OKI2018_I69.chr2.g5855.t2.cds [Oikopleura dioica]